MAHAFVKARVIRIVVVKCPRDDSSLNDGAGALGEDVCGTCQGRFLDAQATRRLFVDVMGIPEHILFELAREGAHKIKCPACATSMTEGFARGVQVDLCRGCGASWLDGGELTRLARDIIEEVDVASRAQAPGWRFHVLCVNCDQPLNLSTTNWLINTRPWCPTCAAPYSGLLGMFGATSLVTAMINFVVGMLTTRPHMPSYGEGRWAKNPDVLRVSPKDADKYFGSFFTRVRSQ
jgi:hypothetical protein